MTDALGNLLGNNGDELMHRVFRLLLKELRIETTVHPDEADIVVVPPSGALLQQYAFPGLLTDRLIGFERRPLIVFPSSALFPTSDPATMFRRRNAETVFLLREAASHSHLESQWGRSLEAEGVTLVLDHDVVASGHRYVPAIIGASRSEGGLLIAARRDRERNTTTLSAGGSATSSGRILGRVVKRVPYGATRTRLTRLGRRKVNEAAAADLLAVVPSDVLAAKFSKTAGPSRRVDASATQFATFDEYRHFVSSAGGVVTNRLHVGLPAAILGKQVVLVEGGYHKISGVYARSLSSASNVTLVDAAA
jgi:exopolysaccharide biosynthesis predicted pyruvyltransferase EpsI